MFIIFSTHSKVHHFSPENCNFTAVTIATILLMCVMVIIKDSCVRGAFFMFVELVCISTNIEYTVP